MCVMVYHWFSSFFSCVLGVFEGSHDSEWSLCYLERLDWPPETGWYGLPGVRWGTSPGRVMSSSTEHCPFLYPNLHLYVYFTASLRVSIKSLMFKWYWGILKIDGETHSGPGLGKVFPSVVLNFIGLFLSAQWGTSKSSKWFCLIFVLDLHNIIRGEK